MTENPAEVRHLTPEEVARRLGLKLQTLENWRFSKNRKGPAYLRVGGVIRYRVVDIEEYENQIRMESRK